MITPILTGFIEIGRSQFQSKRVDIEAVSRVVNDPRVFAKEVKGFLGTCQF
jgi:hypothetical protein